MPRMEVIHVKTGDWDTKYRPFAGQAKAHNRVLSEDAARRLTKNWGKVQHSVVRLVDIDNELFIADGQHRLFAATHFVNGHASTFVAVIEGRAEIEARGITIPDYIAGLNRVKPQSGTDYLKMHMEFSMWPSIFAQCGLNPALKYAKRDFNWGNIVKAHGAAHATLEARQVRTDHFNKNGVTDRQLVWVAEDDQRIRRTAEIMAWWQPAAKGALERGHSTLYTAIALYGAILLYECNQNSKKINDLPTKLVSWPDLGTLGNHKSAPLQFIPALLFGANWKRPEHTLLSIFGITGREVAVWK